MTLGERIALIREEKGWTQSELGEKIEVDRFRIGKYEREEVKPPIDVLIKIAEVFSISLDYLAGIKEKNKDAISGELFQLLTQIEKLPKSDRGIIEAVVEAFTKAQSNSNK